MIGAAALTLAITVGGMLGGLVDTSAGVAGVFPTHSRLVLPMASTAEPEEDGGEREADPRSPRSSVASSLWSEDYWRTILGSSDPARDRRSSGTPTPTVVLEMPSSRRQDGLAGVDEIRAYAYGAFQELGLDADYAWEVLRCESDSFDPEVIYGPRTGSYGEIGIGQLKPNGGLLGDFYEQRYQDPWDPFQQIDYISWKVSQEGWWAWTCAT